MFGSGQWTVWEGYAAAKLMKAEALQQPGSQCPSLHGLRGGRSLLRTFGMDEPMGCYDDIEQADAFVLWGSNMAEMHPILWSRISDTPSVHQDVQVHVLHLRAPQLRAGGQRLVFTPRPIWRSQLHRQITSSRTTK